MTNDIEEYLDHLRKCGRSPHTITLRREILTRIDRDLPHGLIEANSEELGTWIYRDNWSKWTRRTYWACARAFFVWATNPIDARIDFDPTTLLPRPPTSRCLPKPVTDAQLAELLSRAEEPFRTWALLGAYQGLRCIEIGRLHREHVTEDTLTVVRGKGDKAGQLPTHPLVWQSVREMPAGPVARSQAGEPVEGRYISFKALLHFREIGLPGVSMHRLRHWYGTTIYKATKDIRRTQELMRHESPASTAIYTLITDEERRAAIHALPILTDVSC